MDSNFISVLFLGIGLLAIIIGFFIYLLAEKGFFTHFHAQNGDKKIEIQTGKVDSDFND